MKKFTGDCAVYVLLCLNFLSFFYRGNNQLGPFVVMIYKMFATDMLRFVIIFGVFVVQFSQGIQSVCVNYQDLTYTSLSWWLFVLIIYCYYFFFLFCVVRVTRI